MITVKAIHRAFGHGEFDDYGDYYFKGIKNRTNKLIEYTGAIECIALVTKRGRVLATTGISVNEMNYLIKKGYIK